MSLQYNSADDITKTTPMVFTYNRGYGNLVKHTFGANGSLTTGVQPWNRLQPLILPFGGSIPPSDTPMHDPQTDIAWLKN
jgi:hypothetical protein